MQSCVQQRRPDESGVAALCTIAHHYNLAISLADLPTLTGLDDLTTDMVRLLVFARLLGFEAVPLEGEYDQLPEVTRPNIITLSNGQGSPRFVVLLEITEQGVVIANPATGLIEKVKREAFIQQWSGDCIYVVPEESSFAAVKERWQELHDPHQLWRRALRLTPPYQPKALFAILTVGMVAFQVFALRGVFGSLSTADSLSQTAFGLLGIAWLAASWSWIVGGNCRACSKTTALVGELPLAAAGSIYYTLLILLMGLFNLPAVVGLAVFTAVGVHLCLVALLARARLWCGPCLLTAVALFLAAVLLALYDFVPWLSLVAAGALLATWQAVQLARRLAALEREYGNYQLAQTALQREWKKTPGRVRLVVYKRPNCIYCVLYETVLRPAIVQDFGEQILFDEQDGSQTKALLPLIVVQGMVNLMLVRPDYEQLKIAVQTALSGDLAAIQTSKALFRMF